MIINGNGMASATKDPNDYHSFIDVFQIIYESLNCPSKNRIGPRLVWHGRNEQSISLLNDLLLLLFLLWYKRFDGNTVSND